ncbi:unnamed protein product [Diatraea saccharalis]|uniref:Acyltransferase 3 domain-containing protein n=1 Tax=Diatraea saccharalis TaxID=40085 RepID=A0A9N9R9W4_9NEOP|nr:unnamed protein product [Diatraea saccharalis]
MLTYAETHPFSLKTIPMALVNRWLRLMPAVLVVMGLAMTWVPHLGSGPMWDAVVKRERDMCRNNWWQLVILMPNLFPFEHLCLPQAWSIRDIFGYNDTFYHAYVSAQGNWAGYHLGVVTAYFYHRAQQEKWNLQDSLLLKLLFLASVPVALFAVLMGWDLHHREASALEAAVFNALNQNFFALAMCVFIIGCFYKCNRIYVGSVEWGPLQPLGRMSYCAMLLHATVLRTYGGQLRRSFYATDYTAIMLYAGIVCTTYIWALPLYLFVEAPACQLQKILLGPKRKPKVMEDSNGNQVKPGISTVSVSIVSTHI